MRGFPVGVALCAVAMLAAGCGGTETQIKTVAETQTVASAVTEEVTVTVVQTETVEMPAEATEDVAADVTTDEATTDAATTEEDSAPTPDDGTAGIGDPITINGQSDGEQAQVTVLKVKKYEGSEYFKPDQGTAWWAARVAFRNTGTAVLDECAQNAVTMTLNTDEAADPAFTELKPDLGCFKLAPGKRRVGWVAFEAPKGAKPSTLQVGLNAGFGPELAEFDLTG